MSNDFLARTGHLIQEIRVNRDGTVLAVQFKGIPGWHHVVAREGKVISGPADDASAATWPLAATTDPNLIRSAPGVALPGATVPEPDLHSFTFSPKDGPQLVYFEGGGMSIVDHENHQTDDMDTRNLYILDALLRLAQQRTSREIERRRVAGE